MSAFSDRVTTLGELRRLMAEFVAERDWQPFHDPKNLAMSIAIEAAELMEHFQWVSSAALADRLAEPGRREAIADEVADVLCFVLSLANALDLDLAAAVAAKMRKNAAKYPAAEFRGRYERPRDA
jgi:dCTP diphosphatase